MKRVLIAMLCLVPAVAAAQDTAASRNQINAVRACVQGAAKGGPQSRAITACVGQVGGQCPDQTTMGIAECLLREQDAWDRLLNEWWPQMRDRAKAHGTWNQLLADQRKWIKDRDAQCAAAYESAGDGSMRVVFAAECQRDLTARRAVEFYHTLYR